MDNVLLPLLRRRSPAKPGETEPIRTAAVTTPLYHRAAPASSTRAMHSPLRYVIIIHLSAMD